MRTKEKLKRMKSDYEYQLRNYKDYMTKLKKIYFKNEDWSDKTSKLIINSDYDLMNLAYNYAKGALPRSIYEKGGAKNFPNNLNLYMTWDEDFKDYSGSIPASKIFMSKYVKEMVFDKSITIWKDLVANNECNIGYKEWYDKCTVKEMIDLLLEHFPDQIFLLNEPYLKLKNIMVILPKKQNYARY